MFAAKASRYLTHVRRLREIGKGVARYYERIEPLVESGKLGPVVWQLPAELPARRRAAPALLAELPHGRHCFEFRHESWFKRRGLRTAGAHGAALVIGDHPRWPFQARELTTDWTLVRLHHGHRGRRGNYSRDRARRAGRGASRGWRRRAEVFVYFNNDWEGFAVENARSLARRVSPGRG